MATSHLQNEEQIIEKARRCLDHQLIHGTEHIWLEYDQGALLLRGHLNSFYQKQLAQEAVRHVDGVTQVVNAIHVG